MTTSPGVSRTLAARRARRLYADRRMAAVLRARGWTCFEPDTVVSAEKSADAAGVVHVRVHAVDPSGLMPLPGQMSIATDRPS